MFIIQLFNSPGCSLKLQRKLYAGSVQGEKPGDGCETIWPRVQAEPAGLHEAALTLGGTQHSVCVKVNKLSTFAA